MRVFILLSVSFLLLLNFTHAQLSDTQNQAIDDLFQDWNENTPGYAVGVVQKGELVYSKGFGQANLEYEVPISSQTIFHMASVSKQFTAFAICLLAERGALSLDDDIRKYLPELHDFGHQIKIRHLIHHTSGMRDQWNLLALAGWRLDDVITRDQILRLIAKQRELNIPPGEEYNYCNTGYTLMGEIVARVSGMSFSEWMQKEVFEPLEMNSTLFYDDHERIVRNRAYSYFHTPDGYKKSVLSYANAGATSLFTTVEDMAKWNANFYQPKVGKKETIHLMEERGVLNNGDTITYAYGQGVSQYKNLRRISHGGADAGYRTYFLRFPNLEGAVIILSNMAEANTGGKAFEVAEVVWEAQIEQDQSEEEEESEEQVSIPSMEQLNSYADHYSIQNMGMEIDIKLQADSLVVLMPTGQQLSLVANSDNSFYVKEDPQIKLTFELETDSDLKRIRINQGGNRMLATNEELYQIDAAGLAEFAGTYYSEELETYYHLAVSGKILEAKHIRHDPVQIKILKPDEGAGNRWYFGNITFKRDAAGKVDAMLVSSGRVKNVYFSKVK